MNQSDNHTESLIDASITGLIDDLPLEAKVSVANFDEDELRVLELVLGKYLQFQLDRLNKTGNEDLLNECRSRSGDKSLDDIGAARFILKQVWKRLQETHRLRVAK